jgi:hypothetical protein
MASGAALCRLGRPSLGVYVPRLRQPGRRSAGRRSSSPLRWSQSSRPNKIASASIFLAEPRLLFELFEGRNPQPGGCACVYTSVGSKLHRPLAALAGTLAVALSLPLVAGASHVPGHNPPQGGQLSIRASSDPVTFGRSTVISGRLAGNINVGVVVELQENPFPFSGGFRTTATTTTNARGEYSFTVRPNRNTRYRVVARSVPPETSGELLVEVRVRVGLRVSDSTPARGQLVRFSGGVAPEHDGRIVYIQRRTSTGSYVTVARTRLRDAGTERSVYSRRLRVFRDGVFRARVLGHDDHATGTSRRRGLDVH